jgi:hypothetical protein
MSQDMKDRLTHRTSGGVKADTVCMKITLIKNDHVDDIDIDWIEPNGKKVSKTVLTKEECETEFKTQRSMYTQLLCGENPRELIPDALASIVLSNEDFFKYMVVDPAKHTKESLNIVNWIHNNANIYTLEIHIMFMDFLESYNKSLYEYLAVNDHHSDNQLNARLDAGYILVMIVLMTMGLPWDLHARNILINSETRKAKCIDFGRIKFLNTDIEYLSECFENFSKKYPSLCTQFFNVSIVSKANSSFLHQIANVTKHSDEKYSFYSLEQQQQINQVYEIIVLVIFTSIIIVYHKYNKLFIICSWILPVLGVSSYIDFKYFLENFKSSYDSLRRDLITKIDVSYIVRNIKHSIGECKRIPQLMRGVSFRPLNKADRDIAEANAVHKAETLSKDAKEKNPPPHLDDSEIHKFYESLSLEFYPLDWTKLTPPNTKDMDDDAALEVETDFERSVKLALSDKTNFMIGTRTDPDFTFGHILKYRIRSNKFEYYDEKKSGHENKYTYIDVSNPVVYVASENNSLADISKKYLRMSLQSIDGLLYIEVDEYGRALDKIKWEGTGEILETGYPRESSFDRLFYLLINHPENSEKWTDVCNYMVNNSSMCHNMMKRALKVSEGGSRKRKRVRKYFKKSISKFKRKSNRKSKSKSKTKRRQKKINIT